MNSTPQNSASAVGLRPAAPDEIWADLMEGNLRFQAGTPAPRELPFLCLRLIVQSFQAKGDVWGKIA